MLPSVLKTKDRFVAIVELDRTFRGLIDRAPLIESLAATYVKQSADS
jgi:hypothetical protein